MRCETCGEYIYKGKKFNARKEDAIGEKYHTMQQYRFYIRCPRCAAEITFKTDYKNLDYTCEHGASRNFEPWREEDALKEAIEREKEEEREKNPMKALENRTMDSKREMEIMDALDEIRTRNLKQQRLDVNHVLDLLEDKHQDEEDERIAREAFMSTVVQHKPVIAPPRPEPPRKTAAKHKHAGLIGINVMQKGLVAYDGSESE